MNEQERLTELCKAVIELSGVVDRVNAYFAEKIISVQDRLAALEAENADLRKRIGLPAKGTE